MARKPMIKGGTKNKIIEVASRMFFEKGFDGTTIRGIMREVGGEIGLFYYYYKTKDDLFTDVLENFFEPYKKDFERMVEETRQNNYRALLCFFTYMKNGVREFRRKYENNMHRTVRWAIRERTLTVIEPYIKEIIDILITCGANPVMDSRLTAVFLSHGVGSVILHEDGDWVDDVTDDVRKTVNMIMGLSGDKSREMFEEN